MRTTYNPEDDILYMRFCDKPIAREVSHGWNINLANDGDLVEMTTILDARAEGLYPVTTEDRKAA